MSQPLIPSHGLTAASIDGSKCDLITNLQLALLPLVNKYGTDDTNELVDALDCETIRRLVEGVESAVSDFKLPDDSQHVRDCLELIKKTMKGPNAKAKTRTAANDQPNETDNDATDPDDDNNSDENDDSDENDNNDENNNGDDTSELDEDNHIGACRDFLKRLLSLQHDGRNPTNTHAGVRLFYASELTNIVSLITDLAAEIDPSYRRNDNSSAGTSSSDIADLYERMSKIHVTTSSRRDTIPRNTSESARHSGSKPAPGDMENLMNQEIDDVESLPHFDRIHLNPHSTAYECFRLYEHLIHDGKAIDSDGWLNFPEDKATERAYATWLSDVTTQIKESLEASGACSHDRTLVCRGTKKPKDALDGVKCDVCILDSDSLDDAKYMFGNMHVVGEIKRGSIPYSSNTRPGGRMSVTESQLAKYVRQVFRTQPTRHFVLGFILAGPLMRVYQFDRLGLASNDLFNVKHNPLRFIRTIIAFLKMDDVQLGHDPTISRPGPGSSQQGQLTLKMKTAGFTNLIVQECLNRSHAISGRGTTCWLVYKTDRAGNEKRYLVKDSWQFDTREEEGLVFQDAIKNKTENIAKYQFHETVSICGSRSGSSKYNVQQHLRFLANPGDRPNRELRRIVFEYTDSKSFEKAGSAIVLLKAFSDALRGHRSLHEAGYFHRDISISNIMINTDPSEEQSGFLIDFDFAVKTERSPTHSLPHMTGNRIFMAIARLDLVELYLDDILKLEHKLKTTLDPQQRAQLNTEISELRLKYDQADKDNYANDLESFFWVLFWVCCNYDIKGKWTGHPKLNDWVWKSSLSSFMGDKESILNNKPKLVQILSRRDSSQRVGTYKDVHSCILLMQPLFSDRLIMARRASTHGYGAPDYEAEKLDGESLCKRMLAIVDEELERLRAGQ